MPDKTYIPWHKRLDKSAIMEDVAKFAQSFVQQAFAKGFRVTNIQVKWVEDGVFDASITGHPVTSEPDREPQPLH